VGTGSLGWKSPVGSRGRAPVGSGAKPPEARYAYTFCSGQMHFRDVFREDIWCTIRLMWSLLPSSLLLQKLFNLCKSHDPPCDPGRGRVVGTCPPVSTGGN